MIWNEAGCFLPGNFRLLFMAKGRPIRCVLRKTSLWAILQSHSLFLSRYHTLFSLSPSHSLSPSNLRVVSEGPAVSFFLSLGMEWPAFFCSFLDRVIPPVHDPDICQLKGCSGFCLSVAVTAAHAYLPCYFEQWLTAGQAWHSQPCGGACYYVNINIPINTWSTIEKIITHHHSSVSEW